jgi:hypothetical protein
MQPCAAAVKPRGRPAISAGDDAGTRFPLRKGSRGCAFAERVRLVRGSKLKLTEREDDADTRYRTADAPDRTADQRDPRADERDRALEPGK